MTLQQDYLYHLFNQGNNKQNIFFNRENKIYFLNKIKQHILPHCHLLAWCLMSNHFHLLVQVHSLEITVGTKKRNLNDSIGILLRSYTRAINKQEERTGSLFKAHTKAECLNCIEQVTPSFIPKQNGTRLINSATLKEYPQACFDYIHQNPVKANLVKQASDWEFSSASDYYGDRKGTLVNKKKAFELINN